MGDACDENVPFSLLQSLNDDLLLEAAGFLGLRTLCSLIVLNRATNRLLTNSAGEQSVWRPLVERELEGALLVTSKFSPRRVALGLARPSRWRWVPHVSESGAARPAPRFAHTGTLHESSLLIFGGRDQQSYDNDAYHQDTWRFDMAALSWSRVPTTGAVPKARRAHASVLLPATNELLMFGGGEHTGNEDYRVHVLDLDTNKWSQPHVRVRLEGEERWRLVRELPFVEILRPLHNETHRGVQGLRAMPGPVDGHSLVYLEALGAAYVSCGYVNIPNYRRETNETFVLRFHREHGTVADGDERTQQNGQGGQSSGGAALASSKKWAQSELRWEAVATTGRPPGHRYRHTGFVAPTCTSIVDEIEENKAGEEDWEARPWVARSGESGGTGSGSGSCMGAATALESRAEAVRGGRAIVIFGGYGRGHRNLNDAYVLHIPSDDQPNVGVWSKPQMDLVPRGVTPAPFDRLLAASRSNAFVGELLARDPTSREHLSQDDGCVRRRGGHATVQVAKPVQRGVG